MASISVNHISKSFGEVQAVRDLSFEVCPGEIFGLLGPNGSGKTTSIRIMLDIYKPDSGSVSILGGEMTEEKKNDIGYLPEERGLYQDVPLERCLTYLASIKGLDKEQIAARLPGYLEKFDLLAYRKKKVKELSKGMQQKAQLIVALIHDPQIIIIDEPFSALDPINTQLVKSLLIEQRDAGKTIVMCTHQMNQVEQLCNRLILLNKGELLLEGTLPEIQKQFASNDVIIQTDTELPLEIPGVANIHKLNGSFQLTPEDGVMSSQLISMLLDQRIVLNSFERVVPTLDDIFIQVVQEGKKNNA